MVIDMHVRSGSRRETIETERGSIVMLVALSMPVILLFLALVIDIGNWKEHDRQLQNRADAGALAAGVEYVKKLQNCIATPVPTGLEVANVAKRFSGTPDAAITGEKFNIAVNGQARLTVAINASDYTAADNSDGAGPCTDHAPDAISPSGGLWTDVKAREINVPTLFGSLGFNLDQATAQARVEMKTVIGIRANSLPFTAETGDNLECVWAQFVRARDGDTSAVTLLGGTPNPVALTPASTRADGSGIGPWTANVGGILITNSTDDIAVKYWFGSKTAGACSFSTQNKGQLPDMDQNLPPNYSIEGIDQINVYDDGRAPGATAEPKLREFRTGEGSCGNGPGFLYPTDNTPSLTCTVPVIAVVDPGANTRPTTVRVTSSDPDVNTIDLAWSGSGNTWTGDVVYRPNRVSGSTTRANDFVEVGQMFMAVTWRKTTGFVGAQNCANTTCTGTFPGESIHGAANVQQSTYVSDPINSNPMTYAELRSGAGPLDNSWGASGPNIGAFTVTVNQLGIDQVHSVLVRGSVQGTGNRTFTIDCTGSGGGGANELRDAIINGCGNPYVENMRNDVCTPQPIAGTPYWDCVETVAGNKTAVRTGLEARFSCTMPNNWNATSPGNLNDDDPRYAYVYLTSFGRIANARPTDQIPVRAFLRVYVTGWDIQPNGYEGCGGANEPPPRGYDADGAQVWGHFVDVITLSPNVIPGEGKCDTTTAITQCIPLLVR